MEASKLHKLEEWFRDKPGTITAFSGGVDSSLVLFLSKKYLPNGTIGCISTSVSLKRKDYEEAVDFCLRYDITLEVIETQEILDENYYSNPANRWQDYGCWLRMAVEPTDRLRANDPREPTVPRQCRLSRILVGCSFRCVEYQ